MKKPLLFALALPLLFASRAHAGALPEGCGDDSVQFKIKTAKGQSAPAPEPGKAQIIFIQSLDGAFDSQPSSRFAIDGAWAGANRGPSFFAVSVAPGTHHVCASRQTSVRAEKENVGVATLNAEAGKVYVYEFKITRAEVGAAAMNAGAMLPGQYRGSMTAKPKDTMDLASFTELSSEQAQALLKSAALATSTAKN